MLSFDVQRSIVQPFTPGNPNRFIAVPTQGKGFLHDIRYPFAGFTAYFGSLISQSLWLGDIGLQSVKL
jgi:hypothetical protein